ncbi:MAG: flagellar filament capping protein FliD [Rhodoferax sp.]|uniref:flagellar filament capping protein FliD n=1 Tax=Rhodoferax sp. TaxID=50421 RepID=UPI0026315539|nr:flagellar filament capping protein FliD [Rhodoferax sp.]MDD5335620.1 flagellar filament capping protein FliD [Rhodoferax sp.]
MATVSSLGIGSNLDLTSLLASIKSNEQAPLLVLQKQQTSYTSRLTAYGQLNSALSALQSAAATLSKATLFQGVKANSTASDVVGATASATAASGVYAVNVTQLSQAQSLAAAGVASSTAPIGTGAATTLTLDFGTLSGATPDPLTGKYTGATFTPDATRAATSITIDASNNTLAGIRDAINGNASIGVTAAIVNDGSATPNRLVLTSKQSGETSSMRIAVSGDAALSSLLAHDPAGLPAAQLQQTAVAQNSKLTVNGIAVTSASNSVVDAVQGVTMTLAKVGASSLTVQNDSASVQGAITTFVNAYNSFQNVSKQLTAFDAAKKTGAILLGDATLRNIQVAIRATLTGAQVPDSSGLTTLSQIGVSFQKDGTLAIDATKLTAALGSHLSGVANLFSGSAGVGGYGNQLATLITGFTDANGVLSAATKGVNTSLDTLSKQYTATSDRIDATVARYKAQFTQLDTLISSMNQTSSYLTQQFNALNNTTTK